MIHDDLPVKILILGDTGVGKSCFLQQFKYGGFRTCFSSTVGTDYCEKRLLYKSGEVHRNIHLQIWDTVGYNRLPLLQKSLFRNLQGILLLFDITKETSFFEINNWIQQLKMRDECEGVEIVLCGNKNDLEALRVVDGSIAKYYMHMHGVAYIETSAKTGDNVENAVELLLEKVMLRLHKREERMETENQPLRLTTQNSDDSFHCSC